MVVMVLIGDDIFEVWWSRIKEKKARRGEGEKQVRFSGT